MATKKKSAATQKPIDPLIAFSQRISEAMKNTNGTFVFFAIQKDGLIRKIGNVDDVYLPTVICELERIKIQLLTPKA